MEVTTLQNEFKQLYREILDSLNNTFDVVIDEKDDNEIVTKITLKNLKNDGSDFLEKFIGMFSPLIEQLSNGEKQVVYEEGSGLKIRRIDD